MTKSAKFDAPTISLDSAFPERGAAPARQPGGFDSGAVPEIENELVAELESALQAVLRTVPQLEAADTTPPRLLSTDREARPGQAPEITLHVSSAAVSQTTAAERRPSYPGLRPMEVKEPPRALSWELDAPATDYRPAADRPRRGRVMPRAALCMAGLLLLAATGAVALTAFGGSEPRTASVADEEPASDATAAAPEVASSLIALAPEEPSAATKEARQVGSSRQQTAGSDAILLRPVGKEEAAEQADAGNESKLADRLVEAPAPAAAAQVPEQTEADAQVHEPAGSVRPISPAGLPATATIAPSPLTDEPAGAPVGDGEFYAEAAPLSAEGPPDSLVAAEADRAGSQSSPAVATQADLAAAGTDGPVEVSRSAPVTSAVNMRASPDNDAAVLQVVPAGSQVDVIGCEIWCEVVFAGERGWIYKSFVGGADS